VDGVEDTLRALSRGQVRTLLVDGDAQASGFHSATSGRIAAREAELRAEGEVYPVLDLIDEAIEEALRQRVEVEVLYDTAARGVIHTLAGLLRFR
jgi:peptide subunit release factor 1 (eRF1)